MMKMDAKLDWTYPNMGIFYSEKPPTRGTFTERIEGAKKFKIDRIEIPFDLVRLENEEYYLLKKKVGDVLEKEDFKKLYQTSGKDTPEYILHTDPELKTRHYLRWNPSLTLSTLILARKLV